VGITSFGCPCGGGGCRIRRPLRITKARGLMEYFKQYVKLWLGEDSAACVFFVEQLAGGYLSNSLEGFG
jgi:hypothetical protein